MSLKERMRKFVLPTWQEQQERMKREEAKRRANYERQQAILDHQLASLARQEALAKKREKVKEIHKKLHPQLYSQPPEPRLFEFENPFERSKRRRQ